MLWESRVVCSSCRALFWNLTLISSRHLFGPGGFSNTSPTLPAETWLLKAQSCTLQHCDEGTSRDEDDGFRFIEQGGGCQRLETRMTDMFISYSAISWSLVAPLDG